MIQFGSYCSSIGTDFILGRPIRMMTIKNAVRFALQNTLNTIKRTVMIAKRIGKVL